MNGKKAKLIRKLARAEAKPAAKHTPQTAFRNAKGQIAYAQGSYPYILGRIKKVFKENNQLFNRVAGEFHDRRNTQK